MHEGGTSMAMEEPRSPSRISTSECSASCSSDSSSSSSTAPPRPPPPPTLPTPTTTTTTLVQPTQKKKQRTKVFRVFRNVFRSFPIITPSTCKFPTIPAGNTDGHHRGVAGGTKVTGTLFGYRKGRISFSIQETPRCLPSLVVELSIQTNQLQRELSAGMVRVAMECEKRSDKDKTRLLEEPLWTMFCNGKKTGYSVKREATEEDLGVMELLKAVSMGAGVLPGNSDVEGADGEMAYMRAHFEHVVGSKDSESFYMLSPEGNSGPELTVFFIRI
ncbi:hypothetical protein L6164_012330 [Bauhinia variegata]|uniref:Uncharacterized protein n=1 Tax=Bauhinia variegata TaxID=167791 RepID=A0ACB9PAY8_BAUVA|nr:hypothetical protein L6164_012330 [Bauhinia variegata]